MTFYYDTFPTPCGDFSVAVDESGALVATAFGPVAALRPYLPKAAKAGDPFATSKRLRSETPAASPPAPTLTRDVERTEPVRAQISAYFASKRRDFDLPLKAAGTTFQQRVRRELRSIPFGETRSYGQLAERLRSSPRAVGRANAANPVGLVVPCHRVIGADGSLTGFAFGEDIKRTLLQHERRITARPARSVMAAPIRASGRTAA